MQKPLLGTPDNVRVGKTVCIVKVIGEPDFSFVVCMMKDVHSPIKGRRCYETTKSYALVKKSDYLSMILMPHLCSLKCHMEYWKFALVLE